MTRAVLLQMLATAAVAAASAPPPHHPQHRAPPELLHRVRQSNPAILQEGASGASPAQHPTRAPFRPGLRVSPLDFGADPTGVRDSWAALTSAIAHCLNQSAISPNGFFPGQDSTPSFGPIRDMGGCDVDLGGGEYRVSKPLMLPEMNANMQFGRGSLVASPDFDAGSDPAFLFVVGQEALPNGTRSCSIPQGSCNIDINFPELFLDGAGVASGMQINHVMGVTIGPGGYFLNFTEFGLQINAGHEVMMDRCWLGETNFDFDHEQHGVSPNATAIQINGNDHYILNTIVFSSKIGLEVNGAADYVQGVHVWFPVNHAVAFADTKAFHITKGGNRFSGCYIDGGRAVFEPAALSRNVWSHGFECCQRGDAAPGTPSSGIVLVGSKIGPGLSIVNNEFGGGSVFHVPEMWPGGGGPDAAVATRPTSIVAADPVKCEAFLNVSAAGLDCEGLKPAAHAPSSLADCAAACCADHSCSVYQFCEKGEVCDGMEPGGPQCWIGAKWSCAGERKGWTGMGSRSADPSRPAAPLSIEGVRIAHNSMTRNGVGTQATLSLHKALATRWEFDFCELLVFAQIAVVKVHVTALSGFPTAVARPATGCRVLVETSEPVTGTITVDVDSSQPSPNFV